MPHLIDCVIVGPNVVSVASTAAKHKRLSAHSGAYDELKMNSVLLNDVRRSYLDVLNHGVTLLTDANPELNVYSVPSAAVSTLKGYLQPKGFVVDTINLFNTEQNKLRSLLACRPRAVAITTTYYIDDDPIVEIVSFVRSHDSGTLIVVGGPRVLALYQSLERQDFEETLRRIGADIYIIESQGESTLAMLLGAVRHGADLTSIPNLAIRTKHGFTLTGRQPEHNDLSAELDNVCAIEQELQSPIVYLRTARSCPFACSFCTYPTLAGDHVVSDVAAMDRALVSLHALGARYLVFVDDTFNVPLPRFKDILRSMIRHDLDFRWISFFRCSNADEEAFDLMQRTGCLGVLLGIESGDQTVLNYMNKFARVDRYRWALAQLRERGIITLASLICGFPGETPQAWSNTVEFLEETGPTFVHLQPYYHDTRSPIAQRRREFGIQGAGYSWSHCGMDWRDAVGLCQEAFASIENSLPVSVYDMSLWTFPYLLHQGMSERQIHRFVRIARAMVVRSLDDVSQDHRSSLIELTSLLRETRLCHYFSPAADAGNAISPG